jgi:hypothetical protein
MGHAIFFCITSALLLYVEALANQCAHLVQLLGYLIEQDGQRLSPK